MTCVMANHTTSPNNESFDLSSPLISPPNRIFNVPIDFTAGGIYTVTCNMTNVLSHQVLTKTVSGKLIGVALATVSSISLQVTVYDRIMSFEAVAKFFPDGSDPNVDVPHDPVGTNIDQLPLSTAVSFYFDYLQGKLLAYFLDCLRRPRCYIFRLNTPCANL
jgi:hypothetical protein